MNVESKNRWQIRLATLSIFLLGFIAGVFALNAYYLLSGAAKQPTRQQRYEETFNRLGLNETQKIEVQKIVAETREKIQRLRQEDEPRLQEIRSQSDEQLQEVLTTEQWQEFQKEREGIRGTEKQNSHGK